MISPPAPDSGSSQCAPDDDHAKLPRPGILRGFLSARRLTSGGTQDRGKQPRKHAGLARPHGTAKTGSHGRLRHRYSSQTLCRHLKPPAIAVAGRLARSHGSGTQYTTPRHRDGRCSAGSTDSKYNTKHPAIAMVGASGAALWGGEYQDRLQNRIVGGKISSQLEFRAAID